MVKPRKRRRRECGINGAARPGGGSVNPMMADITAETDIAESAIVESALWDYPAGAGIVACPDCGAVQRITPLGIGPLDGNTDALCWRCREPLERAAGRNAAAALACMAAGFLLLFPANLLPLLRSDLLGAALDARAIA